VGEEGKHLSCDIMQGFPKRSWRNVPFGWNSFGVAPPFPSTKRIFILEYLGFLPGHKTIWAILPDNEKISAILLGNEDFGICWNGDGRNERNKPDRPCHPTRPARPPFRLSVLYRSKTCTNGASGMTGLDIKDYGCPKP